MRRIQGYAQVVAILALEIAAIVVLQRIGQNEQFHIPWHNLSNWFSTTQLQTLLASSARLLGLVIAYYLAITTALYTLAAVLRVNFAVRALRFFTIPAVRHSLDKALAATALTATIIGGTATFAAADTTTYFPPQIIQVTPQDSSTTTPTDVPDTTTTTAEVPSGNNLFPQNPSTTTTSPAPDTTSTTTQVTIPGLGATTATTTPAPTTSTTTAPAPSSTTPATQTPTTSVEGETIYKVVPGDNLWSISKQHLADVRGVEPSTLSDHDIAKYWLQVIDVNKPNLRSGNPNLIYPDEQITLPSTGVAGS